MPDGAVPRLHESELDVEGVRQLFEDLDACAEIDRVQVRYREGGRAVDRKTTLHEARDLLSRGDALMVQIRYLFQGKVWCDTLIVRDGCVRLVRLQQEFDNCDESTVPASDGC